MTRCTVHLRMRLPRPEEQGQPFVCMRCGETAYPKIQAWTAMTHVPMTEHPRTVGADQTSRGDYALRSEP